MRRAFHEAFGESIKVKEEIIDWQYRKDSTDNQEPQKIDIDTILKADDDVSQWRERHNIWYKTKQS